MVTVLELGPLLGLAAPISPLAKIVLLDRGRRDLGLLVTEVEGIEAIEKLTPAPGQPTHAVRGISRVGGRAVTVLDPEGVDAAVVELFKAQARV